MDRLHRPVPDDLPLAAMRERVLAFVAPTPRNVRITRQLSSHWRAACERQPHWRDVKCIASRDRNRLLLLPFRDTETGVTEVTVDAGLAKFNETALLRSLAVVGRMQKLRFSDEDASDAQLEQFYGQGRSRFHFHLNLRHYGAGYADAETFAGMCPSALRSLDLGPKSGIAAEQMLTLTIGCHILCDVALDAWATDDVVAALARNVPRLRRLTLRAAKNIGDVALREVAKWCPVLEEITVAEADKLTDDGVCAIVRGCTRLTVLKIPFCRGPKITDTSFAQLAMSSGRRLRILDVSGVPSLTPLGLCNVLLPSLLTLENLNISFCVGLCTIDVLETILQHAWTLKVLTVMFCEAVPSEGPARDAVLKLLTQLRERGCDVIT